MTKEIQCSFCNKLRSEVDTIIEGPVIGRKTIFICNECVDACHSTLSKPIKDEEDFEVTRHTPAEIKEYLDQYVVGQDDAKTTISVAVYNHFKRITNNFDQVEVDKSNLLMIGPSGSGKTMIVKTIAKLFDVPFIIADATSITEAGYIGKNAEDIIDALLQKCNYDVNKAMNGIIFVDEIDKIARKSSHGSRDVSGEGAQQSLLKIIEGTVVQIANPQNPAIIYDIDTTNILFVASGAFVGLNEQIKKEKATNSIGFSASIKDDDTTSFLSNVSSDDLINYGLIPELVGRLPVTVSLDALSVETLIKIITEPKNSLTKQFKALFKVDEIDLDFDDKYIQNVAQSAIKSKVGARGLRTIFEKTLKDVQFLLPGLKDQGVKKVIIDAQGIVQYVNKRSRKKVSNEAI